MQPAHDLAWFNSLPAEEAVKQLLQCCGSKRWAELIANGRPDSTLKGLITRADQVWWSLEQKDWLEAFRSHPKIGEKKAVDHVSEQSQRWSGQEQSGVAQASLETVDSLATLNRAYEEKFGFIFIICASGKTSEELLSSLRERLQHNPEVELPIAAAEQNKITRLRLKKLITST